MIMMKLIMKMINHYAYICDSNSDSGLSRDSASDRDKDKIKGKDYDKG